MRELWNPLPKRLDLRQGQLHLVRANLADIRRRLGDAFILLDEAEQKRARSFVFDRDRDRFCAFRALLRELLGSALRIAPSAVPLVAGPEGKLALPPELGSPLRFNLSHSADWALYALSLDVEVGIDLEEERDSVDVLGVGESVFSPSEHAALVSQRPAERQATFFRLWARKEALIKADGRGFACTTTLFSVTTDAGAPRVLSHASEPDFVHRWAVADLDAVPGFAAAVAWALGSAVELVHWDARL